MQPRPMAETEKGPRFLCCMSRAYGKRGNPAGGSGLGAGPKILRPMAAWPTAQCAHPQRRRPPTPQTVPRGGARARREAAHAAFAMLTALQMDDGLRGVKRIEYVCSSMRRRMPSIQPKHRASSTDSDQLMLGRPEPTL